MGNTNQPGGIRAPGDLGVAAMKGWPVLFHNVHSENIMLSLDRRCAKRIESFCKGICFSNRPIAVNERVYLKFAKVSTSWSGVVRFGFTSHDPATINAAELPRYACPDLTNKPGYWAKALSERYADQTNTLFFYVNRGGDVMFGINGEEKGLFFNGVATNSPLWALIDVYGNTTAMEFVDGRQLNNLSPSSGLPPSGMIDQDLSQAFAGMSTSGLTAAPSGMGTGHSASMPALPVTQSGTGFSVGGNIPVRYHSHMNFTPLPFHAIMGRNVRLSSDKMIAVRLVEEYCNGYVFSHRPLGCGEKLVIQILSVDRAYVGGLAFGMTACDPNTVNPEELPDDSDMLLDRPEYWVVNKDVCSMPDVADELSFHLTEDGEVRYGKNGHNIATLMHVDKTLPLWAFFDVYGSTQKIKSIGIASGVVPGASQHHRGSMSGQGGSDSGLRVALPPPRSQSSPSNTPAPPPRPPPPRSTSPSTRRGEGASPSVGPPVLPPKQYRQGPLPPPPPAPGTILTPTPVSGVRPGAQPPGQMPIMAPRPVPVHPSSSGVPTATFVSGHPVGYGTPMAMQSMDSDEAADNASNECSVCFEKPVDCVLYTCGHMCLCYECAIDIKANQGALCPICRQPIKDIIKIFRS